MPADPAVWRAALDALGRELPKRHPDLFFERPEAAWRKDLADLRANVDALTLPQRAFRTWALVRSAGDGHTDIQDLWVSLLGRGWPVRLRAFQGRVYIVEARTGQQDLIGAELLGVEGLETNQLLERLRGIYRPDTEAYFWTTVNWYLDGSADLLTAAGLIPEAPQHTFRFRLRSGLEVSRTLPLLDRTARRGGWKGPDRTSLLAEQYPERLYFAERLSEAKAVYVRYRRCKEDPDHPFKALMKQVVAWMDEGAADRLILDLRGNGGGNSMLLGGIAGWGWIRTLAKHPALGTPANLLVLTDGGTFSSAFMNAQQARDLGARWVGEPCGQALSNFGEVKTFTLEGLGLEVRYSSRRMGKGTNFHQSLEPDIPVAPTPEGWFAPKDEILEAALRAPRR